jgi:hypothetical protein
MGTLEEFLARNPAFACSTQFCLAGPLGGSVICFHNYYGQIFKGKDVPVDLHLFAFDPEGREASYVAVSLDTGEAVQLAAADLGMTQPGLVAVAAVPRVDLHSLAAGRVRLKKGVGTGFYVIWQDASGHFDTMHEWLPVAAERIPPQTHYAVFDHAGGRISHYGLILMSPIANRARQGHARLAVRTPVGRELAAQSVGPVPAMGSRIVHMEDLFPEFARWIATEGALAVRIESRDMVEPFSLEIHQSGDFHFHHIN